MSFKLDFPYADVSLKSDLLGIEEHPQGSHFSPVITYFEYAQILTGMHDDFLYGTALMPLLTGVDGTSLNYTLSWSGSDWTFDAELGQQHFVDATFDENGLPLPGPPGSTYLDFLQQYSVPDAPAHFSIKIDIPASPHLWTDTGVLLSPGTEVGILLLGGSLYVDELGLTDHFSLQWQRSADQGATWFDISGANADTYVLGAADAGDQVRVEAVFVDPNGTQLVAFSEASPDIAGGNRPPVAQDHAHTVSYGHPDVFSSAALLVGATDPDGDMLVVRSVGNARHGTVSLDEHGNAVFVAAIGYSGSDAGFDYTIADGRGGESTAQVSVGIDTRLGGPAGYIWDGNHSGTELVDFTGDGARHMFVAGSGDTTIYTGSGGSAIALGAGLGFVHGGTGKDAIKFGAGLAEVSGGAGGANAFQFVKGAIYDGSGSGQYDTVTDFHDSTVWSPTRDIIHLQGFSSAATISYEGDLPAAAGRHLYQITDGSYHAEFVLEYSGPGHDLAAGQWGFL